MSWIFTKRTLWSILTFTILSCAAVGFGLKFVVFYQGRAPQTRVIATHSALQDPHADILEIIRHAQSEILISARVLGWEDVLLALQAQSQKKIRVIVLLDGMSNSNPKKGPLGWLLHYKVGEVYVSKTPLMEQIVVTDGSIAVVSGVEWAPARNGVGSTFFISDRTVAADYKKGFDVAISKAKRN